MQTFTHLRFSRWVAALVALLVSIPTTLTASPASAATGAPGPIPVVRVSSIGAHRVTLDWDAPLTEGASAVTDYAIEYRLAGGLWATASDGESALRTATVTGLTTGRDYEFRVAAINASGTGPATALGAFGAIAVANSEPCGLRTDGTWTCFYATPRTLRYPVMDYFDTSILDYVTDVTAFQGGCFLSTSRGVVCSTNFNEYGELGRGFIGGRGGTFEVPGLPDNVISISSSGETNCATTSTGDLWCWGRWDDWKIGQHLLSPTLQQSSVASYDGNCAVKFDGTVACLDRSIRPYRWTSVPGLPLMKTIVTNAVGGTCGITLDKSVVCLNVSAGTWSARPGMSGAVDITTSWLATCVLLDKGTVKCWGNNDQGQLGDGTRLSGTTTVALPEPVVALTSNNPNTTSEGWSCAVGVSAKVYCWGPYFGRLSSDTLRPLYMPAAVAGVAATTVQPLSAPGQVTGLVQAGRSTQSVRVTWNGMSNSALPVTQYVVEWREGTNAWSSETVDATVTSWTSPSLPPSGAIEVRVAAVNEAGAGPTSDSIVATTTVPPARPSKPEQISNTNDSVTVGWKPSADEDEPITGYQLEWTTDKDTWRTIDLPANVLQYTFSGLGAAAAIDVRIRARNAAGISPTSGYRTFFTAGLGARSFLVTDSWGQPAYGGRVTWTTPSGAFQSALDYGLTVDGTVTFPYIPAGLVDVELSEVQLPSGSLANYSLRTTVGYTRPSAIAIPAEPSRPVHTVTVLLPNGLPVVGASVSVTDLYDYARLNGAEFFTPPVVTSGVTNEFGEVYLSGYSWIDSVVNIEYNDGVLIQRLSGGLGTGDATFTLEEMPWLATPVVTEEARAGSLVTLTVTATGLSALRTSRVTGAAKVTVVPPKGASQNCAGKSLTGTFTANGTATVKVCATKSGRYLLKGVGVISTGAIDLRVKGAAPLPVSNARAFSPSHRTIAVTWDAPTYTGGVAVSKYTVTVASKSKTYTKTVKSNSVEFSGLNGTSKYTVTITATTSAGSSEPVRMLVPVS